MAQVRFLVDESLPRRLIIAALRCNTAIDILLMSVKSCPLGRWLTRLNSSGPRPTPLNGSTAKGGLRSEIEKLRKDVAVRVGRAIFFLAGSVAFAAMGTCLPSTAADDRPAAVLGNRANAAPLHIAPPVTLFGMWRVRTT